MAKVMVLGSGGREHALAWKLEQEGHKTYDIPGNGGTRNNFDIGLDEFKKLADFAKSKKVDLIVVGPEVPLANGIVDYLESRGMRIFGPKKDAAMLEGSKAFSKKFMGRYNIPTAEFEAFSEPSAAKAYALNLLKKYSGAVIKADGLAAGKGVFVCRESSDIDDAVNRIMRRKEFGSSGKKVIVERMLEGKEASILAFCDGKTAKMLIPSQDYKRAHDHDRGPNTGGMGAYAPTGRMNGLEKVIMDRIIMPTLDGMNKEGREYKGMLYAGLMITDDGPKVLEYNARFGDPETQVVLPLMKSSLYDAMNACIDGNLDEIEVENYDKKACCVVLASKGYPDKYKKGFQVEKLDSLEDYPGIFVFHAGTKRGDGKVLTSGGRVLDCVGVSHSSETAIELAYFAAQTVDFKNKYFRSDIGKNGR